MEASGNRGFAPPGRTALRSRQSTSPRQSRRFFHIRTSPSQMAQAALLYPYYSSFPGDCNGRRLGMQATPPDHSGPGQTIAARRPAMPSGNCLTAAAGFMENPDADTHQLLYPVRAGDPFHYKKAPQKIPAEPFFITVFLFLAQRSGGHKLLVLCLPMAHGSILPAEVPDGLGSQAMPPPSGRQGSPPHQTAPPCRTG